LRIGISRHKWRLKEPYDETTEIEEPRLLRRSLELILANAGQTPADVTAQTGLPAHDIETLSGLPPDYLTGYSRVILLPHHGAARHQGTLRQEGDAQVIRLCCRDNCALVRAHRYRSPWSRRVPLAETGAARTAGRVGGPLRRST